MVERKDELVGVFRLALEALVDLHQKPSQLEQHVLSFLAARDALLMNPRSDETSESLFCVLVWQRVSICLLNVRLLVGFLTLYDVPLQSSHYVAAIRNTRRVVKVVDFFSLLLRLHLKNLLMLVVTKWILFLRSRNRELACHVLLISLVLPELSLRNLHGVRSEGICDK